MEERFMPFCSECGHKLEDGAKFCPECGKPINNTNIRNQRQQVFEGNIHKCPNCGEVIKSFTTICPSCGFEFRDTISSNAVREFAEKLDRLQSKKASESVFSGLPKSQARKLRKDIEEQILHMIRNFSVPNTKEDILEFLILASSNINMSVFSAENYSDAGANSDEELSVMIARNDAWISKLEQAYNKAKISLGSDPTSSKIQEIYDKTMAKINTAKKEKQRKSRALNILIPGSLMVFLLILAFILYGVHERHIVKEKEFNAIVEEIQIDIANKNYDIALIKANRLHMDDGWSHQSEQYWDEQREYLIRIINDAKGGHR